MDIDTVRLRNARAHVRAAIDEVSQAHAHAVMAGRRPTTYKVAALMDTLHTWLTDLDKPDTDTGDDIDTVAQ